MEIGSKLKNARQNADYTQEKVAEELNVSRQTISNWENNKTYPELSLVVKMSNMYNVSLDTLLKGNDNYTKYINENICTKKLKFHISMAIEIFAYLVTWALILVSYYMQPNADNSLPPNGGLEYPIMVYVFLFPPIIFTISAIIGIDPHWGRFKWIMIPVLAYSVCFMDFCTYNTDSLFTNGSVILGFSFEFLPFTVLSFVGMLIGSAIYGAYKKYRNKKEAKNGTGN